MVQSDSGIVFDSGVDYLTVTYSEKRSGKKAAVEAMRILRSEEAAGNKLRPWGMAGFQGWCCGSVQTGERHEELIVRVSGDVAREHWRFFAGIASNVSRIDLQITVRFESEASARIAKDYRQLRKGRSKDGRVRTVSLYSSSDGSCTIYVGQRVSENYGRVYSKGKETPLPYWANSVRYEAEFKGAQALLVTRWLKEQSDEALAIEGKVRWWFGLRGLSLENAGIAPREPMALVSSMMYGDIPQSTRRLSEADRKLQWLISSVKPSVQFLIEAGRGQEVIYALGFLELPFLNYGLVYGPRKPEIETEVM